MPGNDHHRERPTTHNASEPDGRATGGTRPHTTQHAQPSTSQHHQTSLSDQLQSAASQQSGQGSQSAYTAQAQTPATAQVQPGGQTASGGSRPNLLLPIILIAVLLFGVGGFGANCMGSPGSSSTTPSSYYQTGGNNGGAYTIDQNLGASSAGNSGNDNWTVLMYVCGSDLESTSTRLGGGLATSNLVELTQAKLNDNVNFVIETGGAKKWQNDVVSARYLERYVMVEGGMELKQQVPSASMADQSTFADFLQWGIKNYPADHYMLVIWDHGGGSITGVCQDDLYPYTRGGKADSLTLAEMRDAMNTVGASFDVIGFDTCLMATLETADVLSPYGKYLVASEESEPGSGWDYTAWPSWLASHLGTSGADLGTVICETYYNKCYNVGQSNMATLSTVDLSKVKALTQAFQNASDDIALATVDSSSLRKLYQAAGKSESYGSDGIYSMNMVDLGDLMSKTRGVIGNDADAVIKAIDDAVVFEAHGRNRSAATGLSVFYPLQISSKDDFYTYAEITNNTPYLQFLGVMYGVYDNYDWTKFDNYVSLHGEPVNESKVGIAYEQTVASDGHINLQITQGLDQVAQVSMEFYVYLEPLDVLCFIGSDNDLYGSYDDGSFSDNFQCDWLTIDGNYVSATLAEQGNGYNIYYVPVNLNGKRTGLIVEYDYSTNEYGVVCVWDENNSDSGMAGRTGQLLEDGDEIEFIFPAANVTTGNQDVIPLATMTWHEDPVITYEGLGDGIYAFRYVITDVLGMQQKTDLVFQNYKNGDYAGQYR